MHLAGEVVPLGQGCEEHLPPPLREDLVLHGPIRIQGFPDAGCEELQECNPFRRRRPGAAAPLLADE